MPERAFYIHDTAFKELTSFLLAMKGGRSARGGETVMDERELTVG
jgi:hypothetical protein